MGNGIKRIKLEDDQNNAKRLNSNKNDNLNDLNGQFFNDIKHVYGEHNLSNQLLEYSLKRKTDIIDNGNVSEQFERSYPLSLKFKKYDDLIIHKTKSRLHCVSLTMLKKEIGLKSKSILLTKSNTWMSRSKSNLNKSDLKTQTDLPEKRNKIYKKFKSPRHLEDGSLEFVHDH